MNQQKVLRHFQIPCPISVHRQQPCHSHTPIHWATGYICRSVTMWLSFWPKISLIVDTIRIRVPLHPPPPDPSHGSSCAENCSTHFFSGICVHQQPAPSNNHCRPLLTDKFDSVHFFQPPTARPWMVSGSGYRKAQREIHPVVIIIIMIILGNRICRHFDHHHPQPTTATLQRPRPGVCPVIHFGVVVIITVAVVAVHLFAGQKIPDDFWCTTSYPVGHNSRTTTHQPNQKAKPPGSNELMSEKEIRKDIISRSN